MLLAGAYMSKRGRKNTEVEPQAEVIQPAAAQGSEQPKTASDEQSVSDEPKLPAEKQQPASGRPSYSSKMILAVIIVAVVAVSAFALGMLWPRQGPGGITGGLTGGIVQEGSGQLVAVGDKVSVNYTGTLESGVVFDSGTIDFTVGAGEMIQGFDEAVVGMRVGGEKVVTIPPEKAYGLPDPANVIKLPLAWSIGKFINITEDTFRAAFNATPVPGQQYETESVFMPLKVTAVNGTDVFMEWAGVVGKVIPKGMEPWDNRITAVNDTSVILQRIATDGMVISTMYGEKTVSISNGQILIDVNSELAGKTLTFRIKVINATKAEAPVADAGQKSGTPKVELFIWSYCPYGVQAQGPLASVASLLGGKADFEAVLYYDGHGPFETQQNKMQACIQEVAKDKYWAYAAGFVEKIYPKCSASRSVECNQNESVALMKTLGIDDSAVMSCVESRGADLLAEHSARARSYGVTGSPTLVINGKIANVARNAEAFKAAVCDAFDVAPAECGQTLSSTSGTASGNCG